MSDSNLHSNNLENLGKNQVAKSYNQNKLVKIYIGGVPWNSVGESIIAPGLELYLENDFSPSFNNEWGNPMEDLMTAFGKTAGVVESIKNAGEMLGIIPPNVRWLTKFSNVQAWKKTSPISFNLRFNFFMGQAGVWEGRREVYNPIAVLARACLPKELSNGGFLQGPGLSFPEAMTYALSTQFAALKQAFGGNSSTTNDHVPTTGVSNDTTKASAASNFLENQLTSAASKTVKVVVGSILSFKYCLAKNCTWNFSKEIDDQGFPISGSISIDFETYTVAIDKDIPIR
jgi:hypothetical protein